MRVASTPVENIGVGGVLIVETHDNLDHYVFDPMTERRVPLYTFKEETPTEAHNSLVDLMNEPWFCTQVYNRLRKEQ